jgi:hypothetical protein
MFLWYFITLSLVFSLPPIAIALPLIQVFSILLIQVFSVPHLVTPSTSIPHPRVYYFKL